MKIGHRNPSKPNDYNRGISSSLMQTRDKVRKVTRKIPRTFTAGKVHFSQLKANKASEKTSRLFTQKMNTFNS
ncbi:hypothetical protein RHABOEDO_001386 [Candidatus Rhabdochlamydia oedothoracis]|uniref:Uncharacterized protein n=1 Tax=Candidatus Rhabdochlamydia oedothoracis TaxID=2720720 RepID=A0ABX8V1P2_9BACT|nr:MULTISPECIES: hypothetical protein [Rhabdochlamydia]KAG6559462.1 hypothetical protein RHOW815_000548 [Candidatus Rhabdochlamydia sp. W815]MCL6756231.1 hypothetical protein [Candidatus Rhabdochlamydia oedothoracis]QYF49114.1 hypothetical protein RHABOEDO_001386 [Candidatus Rhabdochlamydia oedothoracis]